MALLGYFLVLRARAPDKLAFHQTDDEGLSLSLLALSFRLWLLDEQSFGSEAC